MSLVTASGNIDYLISDVRLRLGDFTGEVFSDTLVRTALISGIKFLQSKWQRRYQVYADAMYVTPQPDDVPAGYIYAALPDGYGYIPSGLMPNDVFRNPFQTFIDPSTAVITQADEYAVVLAALIFLRESTLSASSAKFVNWSDGEYSYSNVASSKIMEGLGSSIWAELNAFFGTRRAGVRRGEFTNFII